MIMLLSVLKSMGFHLKTWCSDPKNVMPTNKAHAFDKAAKKDVNQIRNVIQHRHGIDLISDQHYSN